MNIQDQTIVFWKVSTYILLGLLVLHVYMDYALLVKFSQYKFVETCGTIDTGREALLAWSRGNKSLDKDHDGKPCEAKFKNNSDISGGYVAPDPCALQDCNIGK